MRRRNVLAAIMKGQIEVCGRFSLLTYKDRIQEKPQRWIAHTYLLLA